MRKLCHALAIALFVIAAIAQPILAQQAGPYKVVKIAKTGGAGGMDYVYADTNGRKLYIPRPAQPGRISVFDLDIKENSPTDFAVEQNVKTMTGAKTITLDTKTNQVYLMTVEYAPPAALAADAPAPAPGRGGRGGGRGAQIPDSFQILAVGR